MKPEDKVLSVEQVQELIELGVEFGDTERHWYLNKQLTPSGKYIPENPDVWELNKITYGTIRYIPAPDMQELLPALPVTISNEVNILGRLQIHQNYDDYDVRYESISKFTFNEFLVIALYDMLIYLINHNYTTVEEVNARLKNGK